MSRARGDDWKLRAQGAETRYETYCRHNGLLRSCPCGQTFLPRRRDQRYCDPSHRRYLSRVNRRSHE